jgi:hypothetical protein
VAARLDDLRSLEKEMFEQVPELTGSKHQLLLRKQPWIQLPCGKKTLAKKFVDVFQHVARCRVYEWRVQVDFDIALVKFARRPSQRIFSDFGAVLLFWE